MAANAYINGQRVNLSPTKVVGQGGEADVYDIGNGRVLKLYKPPNHSDYTGNPQEQEGARQRIATHQQKLRAFPRNLPKGVVTPIDLATDQSGQRIVGYTMQLVKGAEVLLRYSQRNFRDAGIPNAMVLEIFRDLHPTVAGIHRSGSVIGDFNDLNVLVKGTNAFVIDADSFQFGQFFCQMFTAQFVDPRLCDPKVSHLALVKPHTNESDWYAYAVMLMKCLLYVDPYGGVYRPQDPKKRVVHGERPLKRITVFDPEVVYPKPAIHYGTLPDDLLQHFHQIFVKDRRGEFPLVAIESVRWTKCLQCGLEHARAVCPGCSHAAAQAVKQTVRGKVTVTSVFRTESGRILYATMQEGKLRYLYHENGEFKREGSSKVTAGDLDPQMRFRINGANTLIAKGNSLVTFAHDGSHSLASVETLGNLPIFDANSSHRYWTFSGQLWRDGTIGDEIVGEVLSRQTLFWVGPEFGFGFYRAGELSVAFTFDAARRGINDQVRLPKVVGQIVDSTAIFTKSHCWFFIATRQAGQIIHRCYLIKRDGTIEATAEAVAGDGTWLSTLRGKAAAGNLLFAPTDNGIVRLEVVGGSIVESGDFPDTEPFVDSDSQLFVGSDGIYVVGRKEIKRLSISP